MSEPLSQLPDDPKVRFALLLERLQKDLSVHDLYHHLLIGVETPEEARQLSHAKLMFIVSRPHNQRDIVFDQNISEGQRPALRQMFTNLFFMEITPRNLEHALPSVYETEQIRVADRIRIDPILPDIILSCQTLEIDDLRKGFPVLYLYIGKHLTPREAYKGIEAVLKTE